MCKKIIIIGIPDKKIEKNFISGDAYSGGKRHYELVRQSIDIAKPWIDIKPPLREVYEKYRAYNEIVVFASGDPMFFGIGDALQKAFPEAEITVIPWFNSLQTLAHKISLPYQEMVNVSLTGRPWKNLDDALIAGNRLIGILTDKVHTPDAIARRMLDYGFDGYRMAVGEKLGNPDDERVREVSLSEAATSTFVNPNCVIIKSETALPPSLGIPEDNFAHLDGRRKMITKMPVRLLSLAMLNLEQRNTLWDIGFCTGSVSIEARRQFPHVKITAFERRENAKELIEQNFRRFHTPGINYVIGDFMDIDTNDYEAPDAVFIGGHGGSLDKMTEKIFKALNPSGCVVFNSVSAESGKQFCDAVEAAGHKVVETHTMAIDDNNPITIYKAI